MLTGLWFPRPCSVLPAPQESERLWLLASGPPLPGGDLRAMQEVFFLALTFHPANFQQPTPPLKSVGDRVPGLYPSDLKVVQLLVTHV